MTVPDAPGSPLPDGDVDSVVPRLLQLSNAVSRGRLTERAVEAAGLALDRPALGVLVALRTAGSPLRVGEIAARMQVVGPHVTRQLHGLEQQGLVHRVGDPNDRRASLIELTDEGKATANSYLGTIVGWLKDVIGDWSERDRRELGRLLARLADAVTERLENAE